MEGMKSVDGNIRPLFTQPQMQMVLPRNNSLDKNIEIIQTSMNGYQVRKKICKTSENGQNFNCRL